jgi:hypothetical protein
MPVFAMEAKLAQSGRGHGSRGKGAPQIPGHRSSLKPKYGLNGAPKAFVAGVISLLTRLRESGDRCPGLLYQQ